MTRTTILIILLQLTIPNLHAQTNKTFFLGHSLTNFDIPNMVDQLSIESGEAFSYEANIGIGASLSWHWQSPSTGQGSRWDQTLPNGGFENFILTEALPLVNALKYSGTYRYVDSLCSFAERYNPNIQYYIYETWHCTNSGNGSTSGSGGYPCDWDPESNDPWRERLDIDLPKWESIADSMDLIHTNPMLVIPGGQAFARLTDSIESGAVPDLTSVLDLFVDEHHLDSRGNYFIGCVMYSVIHGMSPVGLPNQLMNQWGAPYAVFPTPALATAMQEIAWQTVCDYQRNGVFCTTVSTPEVEQDISEISLYPVPAVEQLSIQRKGLSRQASYTIIDGLGQLAQKGRLNSKNSTINIAELPTGIYFLSTEGRTVKFLK